jgi:hypothetical protein
MRTQTTRLLLAPAAAALLMAAGVAGCGDDDTSTASPTDTEEPSDGPATTEGGDTTAGQATTTAPPATGGCDAGAVRDAIDASGGVAPDLSYEITYLTCANGYGWAVISSDVGESATVLLRVEGNGTEVLNLGTSVCTTDVGIPADIAARIAPPGQDPFGDCP